MERNTFLKTLGLGGVAASLPLGSLAASRGKFTTPSDCTLIPAETAGPFPLDLTDNTFYFRQDVREDRIGAPLHLRMRIIGTDNCQPMPNVRVNIWHCDNEGNYSGYGSEVGHTYLRGYQITDANGEVEFITTFPGWYPGRVCHIHFQVFVNSSYAAVSQLTFDHDTTNQIYSDNAALYPDGEDPLSPDTDGVFNDGYALQLSTLEAAEVPEEYDAFLEVTVEGSGTVVGVSHHEMMTEKQFILGQNYPNPMVDVTTIPFTLYQSSEVTIDLWHTSGQKVYTKDLGNLGSGDHSLNLSFSDLGLAPASYVYQLTLKNPMGRFTSCKRMTVIG